MADIELVIKIPEKIYSYVNTQWKDIPKNDSPVSIICNAIITGTPLPKGHGDLIDRSEVIKSLFDYHNWNKTIGQCTDDVQTIIEADTEKQTNIGKIIMKLYKRQIKPIRHNCYCAMGIHPTDIPLEDVWYDETEEDKLKEKYEKSFTDPFDSLVFEERYINIKEDFAKIDE